MILSDFSGTSRLMDSCIVQRIFLLVCVLVCSVPVPALSSPVVIMGSNETTICADSLNNQSEPYFSEASPLLISESVCTDGRLDSTLSIGSSSRVLLIKLRKNCSLQQAFSAATSVGYTRFMVTNSAMNWSWMNATDRERLRVYVVAPSSLATVVSAGSVRVFIERLIVDASVFLISFIALVTVAVGSTWAAVSNEREWLANARRWLEIQHAENSAAPRTLGERQQTCGIPFMFPEMQPQSRASRNRDVEAQVGTQGANCEERPDGDGEANAGDDEIAAQTDSTPPLALEHNSTDCHVPVSTNGTAVNENTQTQTCSDYRSKKSTAAGEELSAQSIVVGVISLCAMLILLYFFFDYLVYVFILFFALGSAQSTYHCIVAASSHLKCVYHLWPKFCSYRIPFSAALCCPFVPDNWRKKHCLPIDLLLLACCCLALSAYWVTIRRTDYGWILQDILGAGLCMYIIKSFAICKLKSVTILLSLLIVYDVLMVFISPYVVRGIRSLFMASIDLETSVPINWQVSAIGLEEGDESCSLVRHKRGADKDSVMIDVVTGSSGTNGEQVPLIFRMPSLLTSLYYCPRSSWTMLGFGDVIIPGLLISFVFKFERVTKTRVPYFLITFIGYICGLVVCYVSAFAMRSGQPALLFVIPLTLVPVLIVSSWKEHLHEMWTGEISRHIPQFARVELSEFDMRIMNDNEQQPSNQFGAHVDGRNHENTSSTHCEAGSRSVQLHAGNNNASTNGSFDLDERTVTETRRLLSSC